MKPLPLKKQTWKEEIFFQLEISIDSLNYIKNMNLFKSMKCDIWKRNQKKKILLSLYRSILHSYLQFSIKNKEFLQCNLLKETKIMVYEAVVVCSLLYGCETWILYCHNIKGFEWFHQSQLWSILNIRWEDSNQHSSFRMHQSNEYWS